MYLKVGQSKISFMTLKCYFSMAVNTFLVTGQNCVNKFLRYEHSAPSSISQVIVLNNILTRNNH